MSDLLSQLGPLAQLVTPFTILAVYYRLGRVQQAQRDHEQLDTERFAALGVRLTPQAKG